MSTYLSAADVAHIYGVSVANVWQLARRHRWRRARCGRQVLYNLDDVDAWATRTGT